MASTLDQIVEGSAVVRRVRQLTDGSVLCRVAVAVFTSTPAALVETPREKEDEARASIEQAWRAVSQSRLARIPVSLVRATVRAWRHSVTVTALERLSRVELHRRLALIGWILLIGEAISTSAILASGHAWSALWLLIQVAIGVASVVLIVAPRQVATAWREHSR